MPAWPATLPQAQFVGLQMSRQMAVAEFTPDAGPPVRRRRYAARSIVQCPIIISNAEKKTFDAFWRDTLLEGSLPFDWTDPVNDVAATYQFVGSPPTWQMVTGGNDAQRHWQGSLSLVLL